jgi:hypothetical protein
MYGLKSPLMMVLIHLLASITFPLILNLKLLLITFAFYKTIWIHKICELFSWVISTLLVLTGSAVSLSLIAIIILNLREKPSTCLLDLRQRIDAAGSSSLLDIAFTNFSELNINFIDSGIIKPTQPPIQWVPGILSPGVKRGRGVMLTTHPHLVPRKIMSRSYTSSHPMRLHGV